MDWPTEIFVSSSGFCYYFCFLSDRNPIESFIVSLYCSTCFHSNSHLWIKVIIVSWSNILLTFSLPLDIYIVVDYPDHIWFQQNRISKVCVNTETISIKIRNYNEIFPWTPVPIYGKGFGLGVWCSSLSGTCTVALPTWFCNTTVFQEEVIALC